MKFILFAVVLLFFMRAYAQNHRKYWKGGVEYYIPHKEADYFYYSNGFGIRGEREFGHAKKWAFAVAGSYAYLHGVRGVGTYVQNFHMYAIEAAERYYILPTVFIKVGLGIARYGILSNIGVGMKYKSLEALIHLRSISTPISSTLTQDRPNEEFTHLVLSYQF